MYECIACRSVVTLERGPDGYGYGYVDQGFVMPDDLLDLVAHVVQLTPELPPVVVPMSTWAQKGAIDVVGP
jgi:hypothetical protein